MLSCWGGGFLVRHMVFPGLFWNESNQLWNFPSTFVSQMSSQYEKTYKYKCWGHRTPRARDGEEGASGEQTTVHRSQRRAQEFCFGCLLARWQRRMLPLQSAVEVLQRIPTSEAEVERVFSRYKLVHSQVGAAFKDEIVNFFFIFTLCSGRSLTFYFGVRKMSALIS